MGDEGEIWREHKKLTTEKRWSNRDSSLQILDRHGFDYEILNESIGHYRVKGISFWPTTGKFYDQTTGIKGRGVFNLIKLLRRMK